MKHCSYGNCWFHFDYILIFIANSQRLYKKRWCLVCDEEIHRSSENLSESSWAGSRKQGESFFLVARVCTLVACERRPISGVGWSRRGVSDVVQILNPATFGRRVEAAWFSDVGRWISNIKIPSSNPPPCRHLDLFSVVRIWTSRPRCVNSHLVSLPRVRILNSLYWQARCG